MKLATAMRLALLSDIHGNPLALDAVLKDIESRGGVDEYWVLGDVAGIGYDPVGVIERLASLAEVRFVRGNTDRYVVTGARPLPTAAQVQQDLRLLSVFVEIAESFAWTSGV
jgi:predicted phosphodiesterase